MKKKVNIIMIYFKYIKDFNKKYISSISSFLISKAYITI